MQRISNHICVYDQLVCESVSVVLYLSLVNWAHSNIVLHVCLLGILLRTCWTTYTVFFMEGEIKVEQVGEAQEDILSMYWESLTLGRRVTVVVWSLTLGRRVKVVVLSFVRSFIRSVCPPRYRDQRSLLRAS